MSNSFDLMDCKTDGQEYWSGFPFPSPGASSIVNSQFSNSDHPCLSSYRKPTPDEASLDCLLFKGKCSKNTATNNMARTTSSWN